MLLSSILIPVLFYTGIFSNWYSGNEVLEERDTHEIALTEAVFNSTGEFLPGEKKHSPKISLTSLCILKTDTSEFIKSTSYKNSFTNVQYSVIKHYPFLISQFATST
jgi:hypothetical protein